jgi:DNA invertase Pin-like site-specific DNA recombinase
MRSSAGSHRTYLYIRVSTKDQAEYGTSLDGQKDHGGKFCREQSYSAPEVRIEVESAGEEKRERRKEMSRILAEIRPGDVLVCRDLSRWSRDQVFAVHSVRELRKKGVTVRFYTQPFLDYQPNAPIDLLGIIAWSAETERKQTLDRTQGNRQRLRANGLFVEGNPPFGYTVQDRRLVIVPEHAAIVRRIYTDSHNGLSVRHISEALLAEHPCTVVGRMKKARDALDGQ